MLPTISARSMPRLCGARAGIDESSFDPAADEACTRNTVAMAANKTQPTVSSVEDFLDAATPAHRRDDGKTLDVQRRLIAIAWTRGDDPAAPAG